MFNPLSALDSQVIAWATTLNPNSLVVVVVLAVILAPVIYRFRLRITRLLRRLAWISLGFVLGFALAILWI